MKKLIVIVEDDPDIIELVKLHLERSGYTVRGFEEQKSFNTFIEKHLPALIILDLMLPETDGLEICKMLKKKDEFADVPVIMLTARAEETDKILGLELGADDYITKPFSPRELVARVKAVLRRHEKGTETQVISIAELLTIDLQKHEVCVDGKKVFLTQAEFNILKLLVSKKGWVFSRDKILDYLWGDEKTVIDRTIDVHIKHLREKLGKAATMIKNIRGIGYKLEE